MRRVAEDVNREYIIGCLETDKIGFYERLGWQTWRGPLAGRSDAGLIPTREQRGIMILELSQTPTLDLDSLLTIECQTGRIW
jgi:aminoglycoside 2'-N-acetyltransferase I